MFNDDHHTLARACQALAQADLEARRSFLDPAPTALAVAGGMADRMRLQAVRAVLQNQESVVVPVMH